jgi:hypothetical protein
VRTPANTSSKVAFISDHTSRVGLPDLQKAQVATVLLTSFSPPQTTAQEDGSFAPAPTVEKTCKTFRQTCLMFQQFLHFFFHK